MRNRWDNNRKCWCLVAGHNPLTICCYTHTYKNKRMQTECDMANPNGGVSLKVSSWCPRRWPCGQQTMALPAGPEWISSPQGQTSSHRFLSAALLMSSSALRNSLTTAAPQTDSSVKESAVRRSWIGVCGFSGGMCGCGVCIEWLDGQTVEPRREFKSAFWLPLCPEGVYSETACHVKSRWVVDLKILIVSCFFSDITLGRQNIARYHCRSQRHAYLKRFQRRQKLALVPRFCAGWKQKRSVFWHVQVFKVALRK